MFTLLSPIVYRLGPSISSVFSSCISQSSVQEADIFWVFQAEMNRHPHISMQGNYRESWKSEQCCSSISSKITLTAVSSISHITSHLTKLTSTHPDVWSSHLKNQNLSHIWEPECQQQDYGLFHIWLSSMYSICQNPVRIHNPSCKRVLTGQF